MITTHQDYACPLFQGKVIESDEHTELRGNIEGTLVQHRLTLDHRKPESCIYI